MPHCRIDIEKAVIKKAIEIGIGDSVNIITQLTPSSLKVNKTGKIEQTYKIAKEVEKRINNSFGETVAISKKINDGFEIKIAPSEALIDDYYDGYIKTYGIEESRETGIDRFGDSVDKPANIKSSQNKESLELHRKKGEFLKQLFKKNGVDVNITENQDDKAEGWVQKNNDGTFTINMSPENSTVSEDVLPHEFTHIFIEMLGGSEGKLVKEALEYIKTYNPLLEREVHDKYIKSNPKITTAQLIKEVVTTAIGMEASKVMKNNPEGISKWKYWMNKFFNKIGEFFGIPENKVKDLFERMLAEIDFKTDFEFDKEQKLKGGITESETKEFSKQENELTELNDRIRLFLNKKLAILENKQITNKKLKENQLKRIINNLKTLDEVDSINTFIEDTYNKIKTAETQFDNIIKHKENYSRHEMIENLSSFNEFANGYNILDEISKADIEEIFKIAPKGLKEDSSFTILDKLQYSILKRDQLKQRYLKQGIPLLADYLLEQKSTKLEEKVQKEIDELNKRIDIIKKGDFKDETKREQRISELEDRISELQNMSLDKESLIKQLKLASSDEGTIDYLFSPLISSNDSVLALFAKSIKSQLEDARIKSIEFAKIANKQFNNYLNKYKNLRNNPSKFNEGLYEEIEVPIGKDEEGNTIFTKKMSFIQKYDVSKYEKAKSKLFKEVGPKPIITEESTKEDKEKLKEWNKSVGLWFSNNTQAKDDNEIKQIIEDKKEELKNNIITQEEYNEWLDSRVVEFFNKETQQKEISFRYELARPDDKYINSNWNKLYDIKGNPISEKGEYHQFLLHSYLEAQSKLPENFRRGYILPSIPKEELERIQSSGIVNTIKTKAKEAVLKQSYDTEYGLAGLTEKDAKFLPVFYTQSMESKDVSLDLISSILRFNDMVNRYESLNNINGEIALTKQVVSEREIIKTNSKGEKMIDAFAKKMGYEEYIRKNGESFSKKHLDDFIDMIVYGEMQKAEEIFGIDAGKLTNTLLNYSAITTIAVDFMKGVSNNLQGNIQNMIEANSGEFFNKKDLLKGKTYYNSSIKDFLSDFGTISPEKLPSQLIDLYDPMQGKFKDEYGRDVSGSLAKKLFKTNTLFFNQNIGEHEIQVSMLFSILENKKVIKKNGETISLLDAYKEFGINGIKENTNFTEAERKELQNSLHALNKRLNGIYNEFDKGTAQRYALGRLAIMYRKHLIPGYKRRFKKLSGDQELGSITEGYYRTFWNTFVKDLKDFKFNIVNNWSTYTEFEKKQIRRTITEAIFISVLTAVVFGLKKMGDDDKEWKKNWTYNFMLYEATRLRSETASYISPLDAYRVVKSPSAMTTTLERGIKFTDQFVLTWDKDKLNFKKKSGIWKKGDNKSWAYFLKLIGISGYTLNPEAAVNAFNSSLVK